MHFRHPKYGDSQGKNGAGPVVAHSPVPGLGVSTPIVVPHSFGHACVLGSFKKSCPYQSLFDAVWMDAPQWVPAGSTVATVAGGLSSSVLRGEWLPCR